MTGKINHDDYGPDQEGFEKDLSIPVRFVNKMPLIDSCYNESEVKRIIDKYGKVETQKYYNHFHMMVRTTDIGIQRQWAWELIDCFRKKAEQLCPSYTLIGEISDDGYDIEVTFWIAKNE